MLLGKLLGEFEIIYFAITTSPSDEKISLTKSIIKEVLEPASVLKKHFFTHDPDVERN